MSTPPLVINNLSKIYRQGSKRFPAVNRLHLTVEARQVYGFLGANGAGKTTTIRMMLGLVKPSSGEISIFGTPIAEADEVLRQRVGSLVEGATFYPFMSGYDNLAVLARTGGHFDKKYIVMVLQQVGLSDAAKQRVRTYSMGMKQRLGIAAALLNDPDLVILDEPTNGLDPRGMQDMRVLIRQLAHEQGKTVFLSSHLLHDVEQVCDRVAIIDYGQLVRTGTVDDLLTGQQRVNIEATPLEAARDVVQPHFSAHINGHRLIVHAERDDIPRLIHMLTYANISVYSVTTQRRALEDLFMELTNAQSRPS